MAMKTKWIEMMEEMRMKVLVNMVAWVQDDHSQE